MHPNIFLAEEQEEGGFVFKLFIRRQVWRIIGFLLLGITVFCFASLCTWNVADPSFSHATDSTPRNIMGYPGAIFSDLAMQIYGLSSLLAVLPIALWARTMLLAQPVHPIIKRIMSCFLSALFFAGAAECISPPVSWPLPAGLGGILGDLVARQPLNFLQNTVPIPLHKILVFLGFLLPAFWLFAFGSGIIFRQKKTYTNTDHMYDLIETRDPFAFIGHIVHIWLFIKSFFSRKLKRLNSQQEMLLYKGYNKKSSQRNRKRIEPELFSEKTNAHKEWPSSQTHEYDLDEKTENPLPPMDTLLKNFCPNLPSGTKASQSASGTHGVNTAKFEIPSLQFLSETKNMGRDPSLSKEVLQKNARILESILEDFGVKGEIIHVRPGPVVTLYELEPAPGIKSSRVISLSDDIARSMSAISCRVAVVAGRNAIGIELPNAKREMVYLREILGSHDFKKTQSGLPLALGKTINGDPVVVDITKMPHVLVAGTTGSGKSVAINTMILSILYKLTPEDCRLIMIDPKMLELSVYADIPHLLTPVVTDPQKAVTALKWTVREMEERYRKMSKIGVRNIDGFNARIAQAQKNGEDLNRTVQTGFDRETGEAIYETEKFDLQKMPYIVVIIDEMADLMIVAGKEIESAVQRLAQMARAAGIHVIMATQRPSVDVITGTIKANFPTRMSFQVTSKIDSRTILGEQGAEQLLGMGDMLYMAGGGRIQRVHAPFVSDSEVEKVVKHLKRQGTPEYLDTITRDDSEEKEDSQQTLENSDDPYDIALGVVLRDGKASTSYIQRRLGIGYNRAASIIERMEKEGIIGPANHAGKREILVPTEEDRF